jgi:hypothetical protein
MSKTRIAVAVLVCVVAAAGFAVGRITARGSSEPERVRASERERERDRGDTTHRGGATVTRDEQTVPAPTTLPECIQQLTTLRQVTKETEAARVDREGVPIAARPTPPTARFQSTAIATALQAAFSATKIEGRVDGVDCSEYPCIAFGRINGPEDQMAKLEKSTSMGVYEQDILTVLLWASTDEEAKDAAAARHEPEDEAEQSLYAVALYPRADKHELGDNLDRRIRTRTAELWNGMSPSDETAAH